MGTRFTCSSQPGYAAGLKFQPFAVVSTELAYLPTVKKKILLIFVFAA